MDEYEPKEQNLKSAPPQQNTGITLHQAIDFGEYNPEFLANFVEWHTLSPHIQWQLIRKALDIRYKQLITQYAELNNVLDLRNKPNVKGAMKKVEKQIDELAKDRERLYVEYSNKMAG